MKKLFTIFLCSLCFSICYADNTKLVPIKEWPTIPSQPRSIVQKPTATIDTETFTLSVKLLAPTENYTIYVEDSRGNSIYQAPLSTAGVDDLHLLGNLESDTYTLRIESAKRVFAGDFDL